MELNSEIENWFSILNAESVLPEMALRRNALIYPLVTYVNHTIALYLSGNKKGVLVFIERAEEFISNNPSPANSYYKQVQGYLNFLKGHITQKNA